MGEETREIQKNPSKLLKIPVNSPFVGPAHSAEVLANRRAETFRLRVEEHKTYREIAELLGVSVPTVRDDLKRISRMKYEGMIEHEEQILFESNEHLDDVIERWKALAMHEDLVVGETRERKNGEIYDITLPVWEAAGTATDKLLKALELKAKINGLTQGKQDKKAEETGKNIAQAVYQAFYDLARPPKRAEIVEDGQT